MRIARPVLLLFPFLLVSGVLNAQQAPAQRDAQAVSVLQRSLAALAGTSNLNDVTLNANASWTAGSDEETGSAILKGTAIGQGRVDLSLSNGSRSEVVDTSQAVPTGSWCGTDGSWHPIVTHNLYADPTWFFPAFLLSRALSSTNYAISSMDAETQDGTAVEHIGIYQQNEFAGQMATVLQRLSQIDVYLNAATLLPVSMSFNAHADNNALLNIPVQIRFSSYQVVKDVSVPFHVQKYVQNNLLLDMTISSVQVNTGLSAADFQAQ